MIETFGDIVLVVSGADWADSPESVAKTSPAAALKIKVLFLTDMFLNLPQHHALGALALHHMKNLPNALA